MKSRWGVGQCAGQCKRQQASGMGQYARQQASGVGQKQDWHEPAATVQYSHSGYFTDTVDECHGRVGKCPKKVGVVQ